MAASRMKRHMVLAQVVLLHWFGGILGQDLISFVLCILKRGHEIREKVQFKQFNKKITRSKTCKYETCCRSGDGLKKGTHLDYRNALLLLITLPVI